jgi:hypothetical protein
MKEDIVDTNELAKPAAPVESPTTVGTKEAPKTGEKKETRQKSRCFSEMLNRLCSLSLRGTELSEINATLKKILEEMRAGKEPKKYDDKFVPMTVEAIDARVKQMDKRTRVQGRATGGIFKYQVGLTFVIWGYTRLADHSKDVGGLALVIAGALFVIWSAWSIIEIFRENQKET